MSCKCCSKEDDDEHNKKFTADTEYPVANRSCTDWCCIPIFIFAQVCFVIVTVAGMADGNPAKLYLPRDFQGAYCGVEENWNNGPNTLNQEYLSFTMNVSATVDVIMKQFVCSTVVKGALVDGWGSGTSYIPPLLTTTAAQQDYMCDCCLIPCAKCDGAVDNGGDLTSSSDLSSVISGKMSDLTSVSNAYNLFSPGGSNGNTFSSGAFWEEATKYMNEVCLPSCNVDSEDLIVNNTAARSFVYAPSKDDALSAEWNVLINAPDNSMTSTIKSVITSSFTFEALPFSVCPYSNPAYCVPFPGVAFMQISSSKYCSIELAGEVVNALGDTAAHALSVMGMDNVKSTASESFGKWVGDFQETVDTFVLVAVISFVVGIVFLILLRFFIGPCVWIAILGTVLIFVIAGATSCVKSFQCADTGFLDTSKQAAVAVTAAGVNAATNAVQGNEQVSEDMSGDGANYRGVQTVTINGHFCVNWETQTRLPQYTAANYPDSDLQHNYCRNPYNSGDTDHADTIWCVTSDPEIWWEECQPIGVIAPECEDGYAVSGANMREALFYLGFIIWGLGVIWIIIILCFASRINLAIALNKVGALFLAENPSILAVPAVQAVVGILWCLSWCFAASFLLSQVSTEGDYATPTGSYATYAEAYGTSADCAFWETWDTDACQGIPGQCNAFWPSGKVWKDQHCDEVADPDTNQTTYNCYRCSPPRYALDVRFAISFFVFLWNNAFNIALGQMLIAMATALWFFSKNKATTFAVPQAVRKTFRFHVGSVMLGSFIVALVQFIRYLMKYFEKQAEAQKNKIMVYILKCVQCCIWCFEKCIKFINKNAYIQIALTSKWFCPAAKTAFFLILRNALRFATVAMLGVAVHMVGFLFILVFTTIIGYALVDVMHPDVGLLIPLLCFAGVGYIVAKLFMNVFGLAVDTSLQCFIVCEEKGDVDQDRVPKCLRSFVDNFKAPEKSKADEKGGESS